MGFACNCNTVLLRSDGQAIAFGYNIDGRCDVPVLENGITYSAVSAAYAHTVLLRPDGQVVACGFNEVGQCNIPSPEDGVTYTQVFACLLAGWEHTVLLRSDSSLLGCQCFLDLVQAHLGVDAWHLLVTAIAVFCAIRVKVGSSTTIVAVFNMNTIISMSCIFRFPCRPLLQEVSFSSQLGLAKQARAGCWITLNII